LRKEQRDNCNTGSTRKPNTDKQRIDVVVVVVNLNSLSSPTMATVAGRKKSIVSGASLQIDTPVANNTLLNQAAITSLYQECSRLRSRLMHIRGFPKYFQLVSNDSRQSTDPVTQLWDLFSYGIPLCYIFDQLPEEEGFNKINNSEFNQEQYESNPDRAKKHGIAVFAMQVRNDKVAHNIPECEPFTVTDLWDRGSTDGLVKVRRTHTHSLSSLSASSHFSLDRSSRLLKPS
jgi:cell division control protein 24